MADGNFINQVIPEDISLAIECVKNVFLDALTSGRHERGDWRKQELAQHCSRAVIHESQFYYNTGENISKSDDDDNLANACCRLLLALQLRQEARLNEKVQSKIS
jgi:hypothetical protein